MKKILFFAISLSGIILSSCEKEVEVKVNEGTIYSIPVSVEQPIDNSTKSVLNISSDTFAIVLQDQDSFALLDDYTGAANQNTATKWLYSSSTGSISGNLLRNFYITNAENSTTRYFVVSCALSTTGGVTGVGSNANYVRCTIPYEQTAGASNALLVARSEECATSVAPASLGFKTLNAFLMFSLTKSDLNLSDVVKIKSITVSSPNGTQLAGKFSIAKTSAFTSGFQNDSKIGSSDKKSSVTLDCASAALDSSTPLVFTIAVAPGSITGGLQVAFTIVNSDDEEQVVTKTIKSNGTLTLARNTVYAMPPLSLKFFSVKAPIVDVEAGTYKEDKTVHVSNYDSKLIYAYTTDGSEPAFDSELNVTNGAYYDHEQGISITESCTLKVLAIDEDLNLSSVLSTEYVINKPTVYKSLDELVAADIDAGTDVTVSFENARIKSFYTTAGGYVNGVYFDVQKDDKDIEIYYQNVPETWMIGGTLSGTMTCNWTSFNGTWELVPTADTWSWDNLTYAAPSLKSIVVSGTPTKTAYNEGDAFNTAGLIVTVTYSDDTELAVTRGYKWMIDYGTNNTSLTAGTTSVDVVAYVGNIMSEVYTVDGLSVVAASSSYVMNCPKASGNSVYNTYYDVTVNDINWKAPGNQTFDGYWRIGGKSLSSTVRSIYSKTAITRTVSSVVVNTNGISNANLTVNAVVLNVYSTAALAAAGATGDVDSITLSDNTWSVGTAKAFTFTPSENADWTGRYYSLQFTLTNSKSSNYGVDLQSVTFIYAK